MPNVFDYGIGGGYVKRGILATATFSQQRVQGGGDIRRQDMPFVSNRMNFSRIGGMLMVPVPKLTGLSGLVAFGYILEGRNVGQSTSISAGVTYNFRFPGSSN